jgi:hypothetical protein
MDNSPLPANTDFSSLPTETVPPTPDVVPKKPKSVFILLGLLLILLFGAGAFFISKSVQKPQVKSQPSVPSQITPIPTQIVDETANWKTYANMIYGFSFKYPGEWNTNVPSFEGKHESNKTLLRVDVTNSLDFKNAALLGNKKDVLNVSISVWDNENAKPFESILAEWDNFFQNPKPNTTSIKEISQIKWTRREFINSSGLPIVEFVTLKGKYLYVAVVSPQDSTLIDFADQILSTFKFLN